MFDSPVAKSIDSLSKWFVVGLVLLLPIGIYSAIHTPIGSASVHEWLPGSQAERVAYDRFVEMFGQDQFLLVSWDGCSLEDERLTLFQSRIRSADGCKAYIADAITSIDVVEQLQRPPLELPMEVIQERLRGFWLGNGSTATMILSFTPQGIREQSRAIRSIESVADQIPSLGKGSLRMAGTLFESHAVDVAAEKSLRELVLPSTALATIVAWICLGTLRYALVVFLLAGLGQLSSVVLVYFTGGEFSAVLIVLPTLVFMLTLAGAVHLVSYFKEIRYQQVRYPGTAALFVGLSPCFLSTVTTVIGDGSLIFSQLKPIREFGLYCGVGLSIATVILFLAFPALIQWLHPKQHLASHATERKSRSQRSASDSVWVHPDRSVHFRIDRLVDFLERHATLVSMVGLFLLGWTSYGMLQLKTTTKFDTMFSTKSKTIEDMTWIERNIGPLASMEILVEFDRANGMTALDRSMWLASLEEAVRTKPEVGGVLSPLTFLPSLPNGGSMRSVARRAILNQRLAEAIPELISHQLIHRSDQTETWRMVAKVSSLQEQDYGFMSDQLQSAIDQVIKEKPSESIRVTLTGLSPLLHHTQRMLLWDLGSSFASAFLMITPIMMFVARGILPGLLIMVPNVVPITLVFGTMGLFGWKLDIAGILTASIALGIAVDDTLHFVTRYCERLREGDTPRDAVACVLKTCGKAILFTTLINCCAMAPFVWSEFLPTSQFAFMMISILALAVLGDAFLLPALLLTPVGRNAIQVSKQLHRDEREVSSGATESSAENVT